VVAEIDGLILVGVTAGGTSFEVSLTPDDLVIEQGFQVDGDELLIGVPLALDTDPTALGGTIDSEDATNALGSDDSAGCSAEPDRSGAPAPFWLVLLALLGVSSLRGRSGHSATVEAPLGSRE
jgi:hypothetical protein